MSQTARLVIKNSFWLILGEILSKISIFFMTIIVARKISVSDFGKYNLAMSVVMIFSVMNDMGLNILLFRDLSRNKEEVKRYVSNIFLMRIFLSILMAVTITIFSRFCKYDPLTLKMIYFLVGWIIFVNIAYVFRTPFKAFEIMQWDTAINLFDNFLRFFLAVLFIYLGFGVLGVGLAYFLAAIIAFLFGMIIYYRLIGRLDFRPDFNLWKTALRDVRYLTLVAILVPLFGKFDSLILAHFRGDESVGLYNAALKLVWMLIFIPGFVTQAAFPKLSQLAFSDKLKYNRAICYLLKINLFSTVLISLPIFIFATQIITIIYGAKYASSILLLKILIWCFPLHGLNGVFIYGFNALNKQKTTSIFISSAIALNIVSAAFFTVPFGHVGVSFATMGSLLFLLCLFVIYGFRHKIISTTTLKFSMADFSALKSLLIFKQAK